MDMLLLHSTVPDSWSACMQAGIEANTRTSLESSGSNHAAASPHAAMRDASHSQFADRQRPHATSTAATLSSALWQQNLQPEAGAQAPSEQLEVS